MGISLLPRKERIIISTIEVLNEVGIQNLSTKLIAKKEGISEGTLFRHYKNKAEIMKAVLKHFSQFDSAIIDASINLNLNPIETIKYFVNAYVEYYENYPTITALVQSYDSLLADPQLSDTISKIVINKSEFLIETIKKGQENKLIKEDINAEDLEDIILGGIRNICLKWRMANFQFSLKDRTLSMLNMILNKIIIHDCGGDNVV